MQHITQQCRMCGSYDFDPDYEFEDETGYVCPNCDSNVFYSENQDERS